MIALNDRAYRTPGGITSQANGINSITCLRGYGSGTQRVDCCSCSRHPNHKNHLDKFMSVLLVTRALVVPRHDVAWSLLVEAGLGQRTTSSRFRSRNFPRHIDPNPHFERQYLVTFCTSTLLQGKETRLNEVYNLFFSIYRIELNIEVLHPSCQVTLPLYLAS
jgi:hypothetical protein